MIANEMLGRLRFHITSACDAALPEPIPSSVDTWPCHVQNLVGWQAACVHGLKGGPAAIGWEVQGNECQPSAHIGGCLLTIACPQPWHTASTLAQLLPFAVALLHELNPRTPLGSRRLAQTLTLQGHMEWPDMGWLDFFDRELPLLLKHPSMQRHKHDIYTWQLPLRLCRKVLAITLHSAVLDHAVASTFA